MFFSRQEQWYERSPYADVISCVNRLIYKKVASGPWWWSTEVEEFRWIEWTVALLLSVLAFFLARYLRRPKRKIEVSCHSNLPESLIPGSPLMDGLESGLPKCQVRVAIRREDKTFVVVGCGIRIRDHLVLPSHVLYISSDLWVINGRGEWKIETSKAEQLCADVSAVEMTRWSDMGVATAKLGPLMQRSTVQVMSSCDFKFSIGVLSVGTTFGRTNYEASTRPGFSGAAYMNGNVCVGIHCHGGVAAGAGYESLYLYTRLKCLLKTVDEAAPSGLDAGSSYMPDKGEKYEYEEVGEMMVGSKKERQAIVRDSTGHFHITKAELLEKLNKAVRDEERAASGSWGDVGDSTDEIRAKLRNHQYDPEVLVGPNGAHYSGEGQPPAARGAPGKRQSQPQPASKSSISEQQQQPTKRDLLMKRLSSVSSRVLEDFLHSQARSPQSTPTYQPTHQQSQNGSPSARSSMV